MKVKIDTDEWYPVYIMLGSETWHAPECEVPKATVKRWKRVTKQFEKIQSEMKETLRANGN